MMKKLLTFLIIAAAAACPVLSAQAAESQSATVELTVKPGYMLTIPAVISPELAEGGNSLVYEYSGEMVISSLRLNRGDSIVAELKSDYLFKDEKTGDTLAYTVTADGDALSADRPLIGEFGATSSVQVTDLRFISVKAKTEGSYSGTVTFVIRGSDD